MIKCEVIERFDLKDYNKLKNVKKVISRKENEFGVGDTFECDEDMAKYLLGDNVLKKAVVKVIEVEPNKVVLGCKDDEHIIPLANNEELDKLGETILEHIKPKKKKKK